MARLFAFILIVLLAACSPSAMMNRLVSPENRAFATGFVEAIRSGNIDMLERHFEPEGWERSEADLRYWHRTLPRGTMRTDLIGYQTVNNIQNGHRSTFAEYTMVSEVGGQWLTTSLRTTGEGDARRIQMWRLEPSDGPPEVYRLFQQMERVQPFIIGGVVMVLLIIGLVIVLAVKGKLKRTKGSYEIY